MPLIIPTNSISDLGYNVDNSLRFDDGSSDSLQRTPSSSGNRRTWTFSTWFKRGNIGSSQWILDAYGGSSDEFHIYISSGNKIGIYTTGGGFGSNLSISTNNLLRDIAWYHLVVRCDTTQATASDRLRIYLNSVEASYGTYNNFTLNGEGQVNEASTVHYLGRRNAGDSFDGYFAETVLVDGQSLDPTSFGEFDADSGIWKPIDVSGLTFGTNGFYLDFENSGSLGADVSGNGNNFTVNNLTSIDQTTDTCTNNYCTLNPLVQAGSTTAGATYVYSNGNTTLTGGTSKYIAGYGSIAPTQGKWYYEMKLTNYASPTGSPIRIGWGSVNTVKKDNEVYFYGLSYDMGTGTLWSGNSGTGSSVLTGQTTFTQGDIVGVAVDLTNDTITYYKNGTVTSINAYDYSSTSTSIKSSLGNNNAPYLVMYANNTNLVDFNFGNPPFTISSGNSDANGYGNFEYAVPSGYYALNTKNLAEYG